MPTAGTHIKFALDVKDKFDIKNLSEYLSGTVYPDSRFLTKIHRDCTHFKNQKIVKSSDSDFEKGWAVHCICDHYQHIFCAEYFSDLLSNLKNPNAHGGEWWISITALKLVLDLVVVNVYSIQKYLPMIEYVENPNSEDVEGIKEYNELVINTYQGKKDINVKDLAELLSGLGVEDKLVNKIVEKTKEFLKEDGLVGKVEEMYAEMVEETLK